MDFTGDQAPDRGRTVVCRLKTQAGAESAAPIEFRKDQWLRRVLEDLRLASERVADLNDQLSKSLDGALQAARLGLAIDQWTIDRLAKEFQKSHYDVKALIRTAQLDAQRISVDVHGSRVILKGPVRSWAEREEAERTAWLAPGVTQVDNRIQVSYAA